MNAPKKPMTGRLIAGGIMAVIGIGGMIFAWPFFSFVFEEKGPPLEGASFQPVRLAELQKFENDKALDPLQTAGTRAVILQNGYVIAWESMPMETGTERVELIPFVSAAHAAKNEYLEKRRNKFGEPTVNAQDAAERRQQIITAREETDGTTLPAVDEDALKDTFEPVHLDAEMPHATKVRFILWCSSKRDGAEGPMAWGTKAKGSKFVDDHYRLIGSSEKDTDLWGVLVAFKDLPGGDKKAVQDAVRKWNFNPNDTYVLKVHEPPPDPAIGIVMFVVPALVLFGGMWVALIDTSKGAKVRGAGKGKGKAKGKAGRGRRR